MRVGSPHKFLSPDATFYLCKTTICPQMDYCYHIWAGASACQYQLSSWLSLLARMQKCIVNRVGYQYYILFEPASVFSTDIFMVNDDLVPPIWVF